MKPRGKYLFRSKWKRLLIECITFWSKWKDCEKRHYVVWIKTILIILYAVTFFLFYLPLTLSLLLYFESFNLSERCFSCFHSFLVDTLNIFIKLFIKMFAISFSLIHRHLQIILTKKKSKNAKTCENVVMFTK